MDKWHEQFNKALADHERRWLDPDDYYGDYEEPEEEEYIEPCVVCGGYNDNDELGGSVCSECERKRKLFIKRKVNEALREDMSISYVFDAIYTDKEAAIELACYFLRHRDIFEEVKEHVARHDEFDEKMKKKRKER